MGISEIFEPNADLSELLETGESLQISDVVHKSFIKVSEGGSEAAAATGIAFFFLSPQNKMIFFEHFLVILLTFF